MKIFKRIFHFIVFRLNLEYFPCIFFQPNVEENVFSSFPILWIFLHFLKTDCHIWKKNYKFYFYLFTFLKTTWKEVENAMRGFQYLRFCRHKILLEVFSIFRMNWIEFSVAFHFRMNFSGVSVELFIWVEIIFNLSEK